MSLAVSGSRSLEPGGELADLVERVAGEPPAPELLGDEDPWAEGCSRWQSLQTGFRPSARVWYSRRTSYPDAAELAEARLFAKMEAE
jgi:hypothetical protein